MKFTRCVDRDHIPRGIYNLRLDVRLYLAHCVNALLERVVRCCLKGYWAGLRYTETFNACSTL